MDVWHLKQIIEDKMPTSLRFLDPSEIAQLSKMTSNVIFYGGYKGSERKRAYLNTDILDDIVCFQIEYDQRFCRIKHQDILGALLSLGISRDTIGDILPAQRVFFVTVEIAPEVERSLRKIASCTIKLRRIDKGIVKTEQTYKQMSIVTSSLRLDLLVAKLSGLSRQQSSFLIEQGDVKINHIIIRKNTKTISCPAVLSIRKHGRFLLDDCTKRTKKGNIILEIRKVL